MSGVTAAQPGQQAQQQLTSAGAGNDPQAHSVTPVATYVGAAIGVGITCFKNGLMYLPPYRKPWEHLIAGAIGAYAIPWMVQWEKAAVKVIEQKYQQKHGQALKQ